MLIKPNIDDLFLLNEMADLPEILDPPPPVMGELDD